MESLRDIEFDLAGFPVTLYDLALIGLTAVGLYLVGYLLNEQLFKWYYNREVTTDQNKNRTRRVVRFVLVSLFVIAVLRRLGIDYTFFDDGIQQAATDDGPPVYLTIRISTFVKALAAFIIANVLDLLLEEVLVQSYYNRIAKDGQETDAGTDHEGVADSFSSLRPLLYTIALGYIAIDTGIAAYSLHNFTDGRGVTGQITIGTILKAAAIFFAVRLGLKVLTGFILRNYYTRSKIDSGSQFAINRLLTYFIYFIGVLLIIQAMGFNLLVIWTGAAALLVGIGIGLQQTFNDLICGVIILFERSVKVGDVVELSGHQVGTVRKVGARTSVLETRDDIIIFVPNSKLIGENVTNWSQVSRIARFHVKVGVAYGSDTTLVKEILLQVADDHPRILKTPKPIVLFLDFGDSSLDFDLLFYSRDFIRIEGVKSEIRFAIDDAFRAKGVEVPFPQRDLWVKGLPAGLLERVAKEEE
ncbi:mechanosensitive ion channel family protein [Neolewinella antarctica]|uniref:Small-conductance mechanosensitive channel n=1 Tax=Neolewinella antarctica TaxID=442734 RepID=A0ABX0XHM2_9BACT|nr:mechanosensitive ion channel domain-containing protein [Neolewinella antarctica]NJC28247.1 small-conductance mechanosensitive channel [Neolewinella antarctica]